ncbi:MAG: hypothetical protein ACHQ6T_02595 [Myxococcota bacterium]
MSRSGCGLVALAAAIALGFGAVRVGQRLSDGPLLGLISGGPLLTGERVTERDIDWPAVLGEHPKWIELQLVEPPTSRTTGVLVREGQLYVPCDLGFLWNRFSGPMHAMGHLIHVFKRWHEDALRDGRVVLRIEGKRYERQAVRVTDPELTAALRSQMEDGVRRWLSPGALGAPPAEGPSDIWFFRMEPRPARPP